MRFATRAFLWSFVPFAGLLLGSFWVVRSSVVSSVRASLHESAVENQKSLAAERARSEMRNRQVLGVVAENPALKFGLQLLITERAARQQARATVEDQLSEMGDTLGFDFLTISNAEGVPLAGVIRDERGFSPLPDGAAHPPARGYFAANARLYEVASVPIHQNDELLGSLAVGERADMADLATPAVLLRGGHVVATNRAELKSAEIEAALRNCPPDAECNPEIDGQTFLSLPLRRGFEPQAPVDGFQLRSLQNVDAATAPVLAALRSVFWIAGVTALLVALGVGIVSSRSVAQPLTAIVSRLREGAKTGLLPEFAEGSGTHELRALTDSFNQAAAAIREGRERLLRAYVEFVGSLASALDARDPYTAGHSQRVSEYACAIARAMNVPEREMEALRIGALLHDVGKIGISDAVLQKPSKLTPEETTLIQEHPVIGRRILEGVHAFESYLPVVELHHENWDGTGYPHGLKGGETPLAARIVKVADAYDAMTSDRPYRRGISHEEALRVLEKFTGTQLDPAVVSAFASLPRPPREAPADSLHRLADAVQAETAAPAVERSVV
jgi:putative nucleotidyltransferase with HDIG domain